VTDLPRRSFPLVVAPPGGFEDAVRRGRGLRRRRVGGGSAAALVLVGALGYSMLGSSGVSSIREANDPGAGPTRPAGALATPGPQESPSPGSGGPLGGPVAGPPGTVPNVSPSAPVNACCPTRGPGTTLRYATRPKIYEDKASTNASSSCLTSSTASGWCSWAYVDTSRAAGDGVYTFDYYVCRPVDATTDGTLHWSRHLRVDFTAIDVDNDDTVFTYSRAIPVKHESSAESVPVGTCMHWSIEWNGYDDYGRNPAPGSYRLVASSFADERPPSATYDFTHE
jgi:hypothetical protein